MNCKVKSDDNKIYQDNKGTAAVLKSGKLTGRGSKHIDVRQLWISEKVKDGILIVEWIPTEEMIADFLTKGIVGENFLKLRAYVVGD